MGTKWVLLMGTKGVLLMGSKGVPPMGTKGVLIKTKLVLLMENTGFLSTHGDNSGYTHGD